MKKFLFSIAVASAAILTSCSSEEPAQQADQKYPLYKISLTRQQKEQKESTDKFAANLWNRLVEKNSGNDNFIISPLSVYQALSMSVNGADNDTEKALLKLLGENSNSTINDINEFNRFLMAELPKVDPSVKMSLATSVWVAKQWGSALTDFNNCCKEYYDSETYTYVPYSDESLQNINSWAANHTGGLIKDFLRNIPTADAIILSATYFDAKWASPIHKEDTRKANFYNLSGTKTPVDMMTTGCAVEVENNYKLMELDYGNAGYSLTILLPDEGQELNECMYNKMSKKQTVADNCLPATVVFPKFELGYRDENFLDIIKKCIWGDNTDNKNLFFNKIVVEGLVLDRMIHASNIEVTENGTVAAAVTAGEFEATFNIDSEPLTIEVNRPFGFFIREKSTGTILFMGRVNEL